MNTLFFPACCALLSAPLKDKLCFVRSSCLLLFTISFVSFYSLISCILMFLTNVIFAIVKYQLISTAILNCVFVQFWIMLCVFVSFVNISSHKLKKISTLIAHYRYRQFFLTFRIKVKTVLIKKKIFKNDILMKY